MRLRFWGTRGSIPKPGPGTVRYGGNTACVEVRSDSGTLVVVDCGTGAHGLGQALLAEAGERPLRGHLLISHTHWDHIQGIPFFAPFFVPGAEWDVYAPRGLSSSLRETLAGQMQYAYFPITLENMGATIRYHDLVEGGFRVGDVEVRTQYLHHPALTLGYRLEADGVSLVYACDHEPFARRLATGEGGIDGQDRRHAEFLAGADLVVHDAQYTAAEYPAKVGWGHSTVEYAVAVCRLAGARRLALAHPDPMRDDDAVDRLVETARAGPDGATPGLPLDIFAAAEGLSVQLEGRTGAGDAAGQADAEAVSAAAATAAPPALAERSALLAAAGTSAAAATVAEALRADDVRVIEAADAASVLRLLGEERPPLVVLARRLPADGADALEVCRVIRGSGTAHAREVPVIVVATARQEEAGAAAGVTDWLVEPFSAVYARTRVRAWLMRARCRWANAPVPEGEERRLAALRRLGILDTPPEERFDRLTRLGAALFDVPLALVSLIDQNRQWLKSCHGEVSTRESPREVSFCAHAIATPGESMVVPDALRDPRFADSPVVTSAPRVRFYAGCPLVLEDGSCVGTLCLIDTRPRELDEAALRLLRDVGSLVRQELATGAGRL